MKMVCTHVKQFTDDKKRCFVQLTCRSIRLEIRLHGEVSFEVTSEDNQAKIECYS